MARIETDNPVDAQIGRNIARRRTLLGLSQTALANHAGISFQQVQKYETGTNRVACSRLFKFAEVLRCSPADLFPSPEWESTPDPAGAALDECARLLSLALPEIDAALRAAKGRAVA